MMLVCDIARQHDQWMAEMAAWFDRPQHRVHGGLPEYLLAMSS
jgi:hypothetical protein